MNAQLEPRQVTPSLPRARAHRGLIKPKRRRSKIGCLPPELRSLVNQSIYDGMSYPDIRLALAAQGHNHVSNNNLTAWYAGGYQDWLAEQNRNQDTRIRNDVALGILRKLNVGAQTDLADANDLLLTAQVNEVLRSFDPQTLKTEMGNNPDKFFRLASTIIGQTNDRTWRQKIQLDFQKYRDHVAAQKAHLEKAAAQTDAKGGLPPEIVKQIQIAIAGL